MATSNIPEIKQNVPDHVLDEIILAMKELDNGTDKGTPHEEMLNQFKKELPGLKI